MTHQDALTCAAKLAGGLKPKQVVTVRLAPADRQHSDPKPSADVWVEAYGLGIRELNQLQEEIRKVGYDSDFDGDSMAIRGKAAARV